MSESYDNQSAEVVLRPPRGGSDERKCLDRCLKLLKPGERKLILQIVGDERAPLGVSAIQLKKIRSRLVKCMNKCLEETGNKVFPR
jgi:hypothetical protein